MKSKVRTIRERLKITQKEMADKMDISESYYSQLENGNRRMSLDNALKIASAFKMTPNEIFLAKDFSDRQVNQEQAAIKEAV